MKWLYFDKIVLNTKLKGSMKNDYKIGDRCQRKYFLYYMINKDKTRDN